jgi:hypothetical protein
MKLAGALGLYLLLSAAAIAARELQALENGGFYSGVLSYGHRLQEVTTGDIAVRGSPNEFLSAYTSHSFTCRTSRCVPRTAQCASSSRLMEILCCEGFLGPALTPPASPPCQLLRACQCHAQVQL